MSDERFKGKVEVAGPLRGIYRKPCGQDPCPIIDEHTHEGPPMGAGRIQKPVPRQPCGPGCMVCQREKELALLRDGKERGHQVNEKQKAEIVTLRRELEAVREQIKMTEALYAESEVARMVERNAALTDRTETAERELEAARAERDEANAAATHEGEKTIRLANELDALRGALRGAEIGLLAHSADAVPTKVVQKWIDHIRGASVGGATSEPDLRRERDAAQEQVWQLVGDVQAISQDYTNAHKELKVLQGMLREALEWRARIYVFETDETAKRWRKALEGEKT